MKNKYLFKELQNEVLSLDVKICLAEYVRDSFALKSGTVLMLN